MQQLKSEQNQNFKNQTKSKTTWPRRFISTTGFLTEGTDDVGSPTNHGHTVPIIRSSTFQGLENCHL